MQPLQFGASPPAPTGFSRTPNLSGMVGGGKDVAAAGRLTEGRLSENRLTTADITTEGKVRSAPCEEKKDFRLRVGVDTVPPGGKCNVFVVFSRQPGTMPELLDRLREVLVWDWIGDGKHSNISISHLLLWSEIEQQWQYLTDPQDLIDGDQIYVFQKYQQNYTEGPLPPPRGTVQMGETVNFRSPGTLRVAADLYSTKVNFEVKYDSMPTIRELLVDVERLLTYEAVARKPEGVRHKDTIVSQLLAWDPGCDSWYTVVESSQLVDKIQLYARQDGVVEVEGKMAVPTVLVPGGKTLRKAWEIYHKIDVNRTGRVLEQDFVDVFKSLGLEFPESSYVEMFRTFDADRDGKISFAEFSQLGILYPSILDYLVTMSTEFETYWRKRAAFLQQEHQNTKLLRKSQADQGHLENLQDNLKNQREQHEEDHRMMLSTSGLRYGQGSYRRSTRSF